MEEVFQMINKPQQPRILYPEKLYYKNVREIFLFIFIFAQSLPPPPLLLNPLPN